MTKSFVDALKAKYCEDDDDTSNNFIVNFVFTNRPRKNSGGEGDAELAYLTSVVLSMSRVSHAGIPSEGLTTLCPNITDLDLSSNLIGCWHEVICIFKALDNLKFVNLSGNDLKDPKNSLTQLAGATFGIESLVLNSCHMPWEDVVLVTSCLPHLCEFHASKNGYEDIPVPAKTLCKCLQNVQVLHLTDNRFTRWQQVAKLSLLPNLDTLILSENPLCDIDYDVSYSDDEDQEDIDTEAECMEQTVIVKELVNKLIEDTIATCDARDRMVGAPPPDQCEVYDPAVYDSGMEDSHPNTPRHDRRECLLSQGSEDGDQYGIAEAGVGLAKRTGDGDPATWQNDAADHKERTSPDINECGTPSDSSSNRKHKHRKRTKSRGQRSPDRKFPEDGETRGDVSTDKFAYFEIAWDAEDEAIGHEEEEALRIEEEPSEDSASFPKLKVLCVTNTRVREWSDIKSLRLFPSLNSLRIKGIPFLEDLSLDDKRKLMVASLPSVQILNGSQVQEEEREKSERFFIRHFSDRGEAPSWLSELVQRHGNLKPVVDIDIGRGFKEYAMLSFVWGGHCVHRDSIRVVQNVIELRRYCAKLVKEPVRHIRMHHLTKNEYTGAPEYNELKSDLLPMSRYDMVDGDEIHIDFCRYRDISVSFVDAKRQPQTT